MNKDTDGGLQPGRDPDDIDAAQAALNRMRDAAAARGEIRRKAPPRPGSGSQKPARGAGTRGFTQFHGTGRDPLGLGTVVGRLVAERGWSSPVSFTDTTLHVRCDSTAWATQLRLLSLSLLEKFRLELGDGVVTSIQVLGPAAPSWRKGSRTVNGRGPRDTYG